MEFEQNRMVPNYTKFWAFWQKKKKKKTIFYNQFWQKVDAILEDVSVAEIIICLMLNYNLKTIIFQCSKNYGTPTLVTRLKFAPNMADPISLNENLP